MWQWSGNFQHLLQSVKCFCHSSTSCLFSRPLAELEWSVSHSAHGHLQLDTRFKYIVFHSIFWHIVPSAQFSYKCDNYIWCFKEQFFICSVNNNYSWKDCPNVILTLGWTYICINVQEKIFQMSFDFRLNIRLNISFQSSVSRILVLFRV